MVRFLTKTKKSSSPTTTNARGGRNSRRKLNQKNNKPVTTRNDRGGTSKKKWCRKGFVTLGLGITALTNLDRAVESLKGIANNRTTIIFDSSSSSQTTTTNNSSGSPDTSLTMTTTVTKPQSTLLPWKPHDACPDEYQPEMEYMPISTIRQVIKDWYSVNCPPKYDNGVMITCYFDSLGQYILKTATTKNQILLSVQVGGMDGSEADPIHWMFVDGLNPDQNLTHWLPVVIEPVPTNFVALQKTYQNIQQTKNLKCFKLINAAISYHDHHDHHDRESVMAKTNEADATSTSTGTMGKTCGFCHFDMSKNNDNYPNCRDHPDFMKTHLGTLDCNYSREYFKGNLDCLTETPIPCGPLGHTLLSLGNNNNNNNNIPITSSIGFLQLDIEGYEDIVLRGFIKELLFIQQQQQQQQQQLQQQSAIARMMSSSDLLPPILHFEHKVMSHHDLNQNKTIVKDLLTYLKELGYEIINQGEDYLALMI